MPRFFALALFALVVLAVAACGETVIDDVKTEDTIEQNLEQSSESKVDSVDCPSGVEVEKGATFECVVTWAGGEEETATLRIRNDDADISLVDLSPNK